MTQLGTAPIAQIRSGSFVHPLRQAVRVAEGIGDGDHVEVEPQVRG